MSEFLIELSSQKDWNDPNYNNLTQLILLSTELLLSSKLFRKIISIQNILKCRQVLSLSAA